MYLEHFGLRGARGGTATSPIGDVSRDLDERNCRPTGNEFLGRGGRGRTVSPSPGVGSPEEGVPGESAFEVHAVDVFDVGALEEGVLEEGVLEMSVPGAGTVSPTRFSRAVCAVAMTVLVVGSAAHLYPDRRVNASVAHAASLPGDPARTGPAVTPEPAAPAPVEKPDEEQAVRTLLPRYIEPRIAAKPANEADSVPADEAPEENRAERVAGPIDSARPRDAARSRTGDATVKKVSTKGSTKAASALVAAAPSQASEASSIEITRRSPSRADALSAEYRAATAAYRRGDLPEAERGLKALLARDDAAHEARLLLVRLRLEQDRTEEARRLLHAGLLRHPRHVASASLYAQLLAGTGREHEAVEVMRAALPAARRDAAFHALLALLYQRTGLVREAVRSYRLALRLEPARGDWWVGLGIVSEQAGDERLAERAYREALRHPLDSALEDYAKLRRRQGSARGGGTTMPPEREG